MATFNALSDLADPKLAGLTLEQGTGMVATAAPTMQPLASSNLVQPTMVATTNQFPNVAPNYMAPGPVLTPAPQPNPWGNVTASLDASGNGVTGNYQASQINWNQGPGYTSPGNHNQLVQDSINSFSDQGGAYLTNATRRGLEAAGSRGLLNSSIAAGAANRSAIEAMQPYVSQAVDLAKQREGWAFQSGESALDRSLQVAVENGKLSQGMAELLATHTFQGNQAEFDRGLQSYLQQGRIDADTASQLRQIGHQSMQASLDRTQQQTLQNQQYAFQGEQAAFDRAAREKLQSDATFQQDWLQSRNFSREFQSQLSMIPLSAAADLTSYISKYAVENPDVYTPEIINGMSNFMAQNMQSILSQYFPNQTSYTSTTQTGTNVPLPGGNVPPVTIAGGP